MYLLDTNICIDFVDGRSDIARQRVKDNFKSGLYVSAITAAELLVGPRESNDPEGDREKAERFLSIVTNMDFDHLAAEHYAMLVQRIGVNRRSFDRLIAAHALALGAVLVTNNEKHFADVPGLKVENWTV
ncbi:type II toxin-antitoxin system VapC family toxin [Sphingorhabdus sp. EL138]|uniref:type II toxin-antitoxin system VapC family toxin n=1 Tax=Sphingorhabdus sp. EL138 TaxID=2073156 RepID=UPI0025D595DA|nr:type II toxin-antitoxin system VapC family toxin [Sphingorhabdus sp. EL138]